jgi:hypothetical protein
LFTRFTLVVFLVLVSKLIKLGNISMICFFCFVPITVWIESDKTKDLHIAYASIVILGLLKSAKCCITTIIFDEYFMFKV